ncbi:PBP1b-binding outer membrane lipoprotein LpoB [Rhizobium petrolearium]|nr:PBP1b-binding outer membrane lipoprotein LpoB [Neorhizobium petrolearium]
MKSIIALTAICIVLAGCTQTSRYTSVPGYAHRTDPTCKRTQPPSKYDPKCDCPDVGYEGFSPPVTCGSR